jgi:hypothetical protein
MYLCRDVQYDAATRDGCRRALSRYDCQLHHAAAQQRALVEYRPSIATTGGLTLPRFR